MPEEGRPDEWPWSAARGASTPPPTGRTVYGRPPAGRTPPPYGRHSPHEWPPRPVQPRRRRPDTSRWHWLLFVPIVLPLLPALYNRTEPRLLGLPFFYWCQLAFAGLAALIVGIVHLATKDR